MNNKIVKYAKAEGFCCLWAFLEANRATLTSKLNTSINTHIEVTARALRTARRKHRLGETKCEGVKGCLAQKIKDGHTIP